MSKKINSREKGKRGERMWRDFLESYGLSARRGQQFSGGDDSPDVVCDEMDDLFHFEVKFVEKLNLRNAVQQAQEDASDDKIAVVSHKTKNKPWLVTVSGDDFMEMALFILSQSDKFRDN